MNIYEATKTIADQIKKLKTSTIDTFPFFVRIEYLISEGVEILNWHESQAFHFRLYWNDENDIELSGCGIADAIGKNEAKNSLELFKKAELNLKNTTENIRYFGGISFNLNEKDADYWKPFQKFRLVVPRFEYYKKNNKYYFAANICFKSPSNINKAIDDFSNDLKKLNFSTSSPLNLNLKIKTVLKIPVKNDWIALLNEAKKQIDENKIQKVVLARMSKFEFIDAPNEKFLIEKLNKNNTNTITFSFSPENGICFCGATPELLFKKEGRLLQTQALAGTKKRENSIVLDKAKEEELLNSKKERKEHALVVNYISEILHQLCSTYLFSNTNVLKLATMQHLSTELNGVLKKNTTVADIINLLHPTPAVCGIPQQDTFKFISDFEPLNRGLYAGPVGWISAKSAKFAVAIRSALINNNFIYVFAGAGIISESNPEEEWNETEIKLNNFERLFYEN